jgi:hypothetical protein
LSVGGPAPKLCSAQSFGTGIRAYNVITVSTPVILLCAVVYYLAGHRLGWAVRSRTGPATDAPASLTVPEAGN